jgi:hypothetical protein
MMKQEPRITVRFTGEPDRERTLEWLRGLIERAQAAKAAKAKASKAA